jgi:hypothetical protein
MKNKENKCYPGSVTGNSKVTLLPDEQLKCWSIFRPACTHPKSSNSNGFQRTGEHIHICAKQYHDTHHNITFNNSYTKIRKDEYTPTSPE